MSTHSKQEIINVMTPIVVSVTGMDEDEVESILERDPKEVSITQEFAHLDADSSKIIRGAVEELGWYIKDEEVDKIYTFNDLIVYINKVSDVVK